MRKIILTLLIVLSFSLISFAEDETMTTQNYKVIVDVAEDNSYSITENITVDFLEPHHGIFRYVPMKGAKITNIEVPNYEKSVYNEDDYKVFKIGSPNETLKGEHSYTIKYKLSPYKDNSTEKDLLLLNIMPTPGEK